MRPVRCESRIISGTTRAHATNASNSGHRPGSRWSRRLVSEPELKKSPTRSVESVREWKSPAEVERALVDRVEHRAIIDALDQVRNAVRDLDHLRLTHSTRGHERGADTHAAGIELRSLVEGDGVAVESDANRVGHVLNLLARPLLSAQIDEHQVVVGAAAH